MQTQKQVIQPKLQKQFVNVLDEILDETPSSLLEGIITENIPPPPKEATPRYYLKQEYNFALHTTANSLCVGNGNEWKLTMEVWSNQLDSMGFVVNASVAGYLSFPDWSTDGWEGSCEEIAGEVMGIIINSWAGMNLPHAVVTLSRGGKSVSVTWQQGQALPRGCVIGERGISMKKGCGLPLDLQISG